MIETEYELLYIIPNKFTDAEVGPIVTKVEDMLKSSGLTVVKSENLGKRKLAYPIQQFNHGYYVLCEFKGTSENINKINETLGLSPEILRHSLTMKVNTGLDEAKRLKLAQEMEMGITAGQDTVEYKAKPAAPVTQGKYIVNISKEISEAAKETDKPATLNEPPPQGDNKLDVKELDKKLDELLKDL